MDDFKTDDERFAFLVATAREFLKADINVLARSLKRNDRDGTGTANLVSGFGSAVVAAEVADDFFIAEFLRRRRTQVTKSRGNLNRPTFARVASRACYLSPSWRQSNVKRTRRRQAPVF